MSVTLLQLLTTLPGEGSRLLDVLREWSAQHVEVGDGLEQLLTLIERRRPDGYVVLSDWSAATSAEAIEEASQELSLRIADLLVFEPATYRLRPLHASDGNTGTRGTYDYVGASLTFAPETLAETVEQVAIAEGERLSGQPGFVWTKRLRSVAGPAVVFTCSAWGSHADFERALEAVMEPVEDRIDLLGCKQVFFSLSPAWEMRTPDSGPRTLS